MIIIRTSHDPNFLNRVNVGFEIHFWAELELDSTSSNGIDVNSINWHWNFGEENLPELSGSGPHVINYSTSGEKTVTCEVSYIDSNSSSGINFESETLNIQVSEFNSEILGPDLVIFGRTGKFQVNAGAQYYYWSLNGASLSQFNDLNEIEILFDEPNEQYISVQIVNGMDSVELVKTVVPTFGAQTERIKYTQNLIPKLRFFNKEGDLLNFDLMQNDNSQYWQGELMFDRNSTEIFKTQALYVFEEVDPINIESADFRLSRFQLFNEKGFDFISAREQALSIQNIEPAHIETGFYAKWVYIEQAQNIFKIGDQVWFEDIELSEQVQDFQKFEQTGTNTGGVKLYTIIRIDFDRIQIITETDNKEWNDLEIKFISGTLHIKNIIRVWDFENLNPNWNEIGFEVQNSVSGLYHEKKLTVVGSAQNDQVLSVDFIDQKHVFAATARPIWQLNANELGAGSDLILKINFLNQKPNLGNHILHLVPDLGLGNANFMWADHKISALLKNDTQFEFQLVSNEDYFNGTHQIISRGAAKDVLTFNATDQIQWQLECLNRYNMILDLPKIQIIVKNTRLDRIEPFFVDFSQHYRIQFLLNIHTQMLQENKTETEIRQRIEAEISIFELTNIIKSEILKQVSAISISSIEQNYKFKIQPILGYEIQEIRVVKRQNIENLQATKLALLQNGFPTQIQNGTQTVEVSENTVGAVFYNSSTETIWIQESWNDMAQWRAINANQEIILFETSEPEDQILIPFSADIILFNSEVELQQSWSNVNLLIQIRNALENLEDVHDPTHQLYDQIQLEIQQLFERFIRSWNSTLNYYNLHASREGSTLILKYLWPLTTNDEKFLPLNLEFARNNLYENEDFPVISNTIQWESCYQIPIKEQLVTELHNPETRAQPWRREIIIDQIDSSYGLSLIINGIEYNVQEDDVVGGGDVDELLDVSETLQDWGNQRIARSEQKTKFEGLKFFQELISLGLMVKLESRELENSTSGESIFNTIILEAQYPNQEFDLEILGTLNGHRILDSEYKFLVETTNINFIINDTTYSASGINLSDTLSNWLQTWHLELLGIGIVANLIDDDTLQFAVLDDDLELEIQITIDRSPLPGEILFQEQKFRIWNPGIVISGNEILSLGPDFQAFGFSTGMLVNVTGSKFNNNNQLYNILYVEPNHIALSYQGSFFDSTQTWQNIYQNHDWDWEDYDDQIELLTFETSPRILNGEAAVQLELNLINVDFANVQKIEWFFEEREPIFIEGLASTSGETQFVTYEEGEFQISVTVYYETHVDQDLKTIIIDPHDNQLAYLKELPEDDITLRTEVFLRMPRMGYDEDTSIQLIASWLEPEQDEIFFYDFSGNQLLDEGNLTYIGPKPLISQDDPVFLNKTKNPDVKKIAQPKAQQTVFEELIFDLEKIDSNQDLTFAPEPLQIFMGYSATQEGVHTRTLVLQYFEDVSARIETRKINPFQIGDNLDFQYYQDVVFFIPETNEIKISYYDGRPSEVNFLELGFKPGQFIQISGKDNTNSFGQTSLLNSGLVAEIKNVGINVLQLQADVGLQSEMSLKITKNWRAPYNNLTTSFDVMIQVLPYEIGRVKLKGQSENEDFRFALNVQNFGLRLDQKDTFIFKEYDINEKSIDWRFLNRKRKELLNLYPEIYRYIGSYKAVINAINFFGYNDLKFNEYYRNKDPKSKLFGQLHKVEVLDIFNNLVPGYRTNDFVLGKFPNVHYKKTNLFNLTYAITDRCGNSVLNYSLDEVVSKLLGLKKWLQQEIMPIGKRILDITGHSEVCDSPQIVHSGKNVLNFEFEQNLEGIDFDVEAYLNPVQSGSNVWNIHIKFAEDQNIANYFELKIKTRFKNKQEGLEPVQTINLFKTDFLPYNFTVNANEDPFIEIKTTAFNGYGAIWTTQKNYVVDQGEFVGL